jgi:hypothetical protein
MAHMTDEDIEEIIQLGLIFGGGLLAVVGSLVVFGFGPTALALGVLSFSAGWRSL